MRLGRGWGGAIVLGLLLAAGTARAKGVLGVDANLSERIGDGSGALNLGYGFNVRAGLGVPLPMVTLELGAMFRFNQWSLDVAGLEGNQQSHDLMAGGRIGVGAFFRPWVAFYLGYGHIGSEQRPTGGVTTESGSSGTAYLVGGGVDIVFSILSLGLHLDYNKDSVDAPMGVRDAFQWLAFGANATLSF